MNAQTVVQDEGVGREPGGLPTGGGEDGRNSNEFNTEYCTRDD